MSTNIAKLGPTLDKIDLTKYPPFFIYPELDTHLCICLVKIGPDEWQMIDYSIVPPVTMGYMNNASVATVKHSARENGNRMQRNKYSLSKHKWKLLRGALKVVIENGSRFM